MTTLTAALDVSDLKVMVTILDLPVVPSSGIWPATPWTLWMVPSVGIEREVRGAIDYPLTDVPGVVITDREFPLSQPFHYEVRYRTSTATVVVSSNTITPPTRTKSRLSIPVTGEGVDLVYATYPERTREARGQVLDVDGRPDAYVVTSMMTSPAGEVGLKTDTVAAARTLEAILAPGRVILLRPWNPDLDDLYLWVQSYRAARPTLDPGDGERWHTLTVRETSMPEPNTLARGTTLDDLHAAYPGTLADVAAAFSTLLEVSAAPL